LLVAAAVFACFSVFGRFVVHALALRSNPVRLETREARNIARSVANLGGGNCEVLLDLAG
jgi:hypothetical protein